MTGSPATAEPDDVAAPTVRYAEPARSYRSIWYSLGVLAVGFGIDLAIGVHGAVTHLPGWILFGAVLVGIQALILYAARATHSLTLSDDELRVGDEALPVATVAGEVALGEQAAEDVPVLGWPGGRPRGVKAVVLRLDDEREVEIPTRHPDRLRAAMGLVRTPTRPRAHVRPATPDDLQVLPDVDERAEAIFRVAGHVLPPTALDPDALAAAAAVFVVDDPPVGFVLVDELDGAAHVQELAVLPGAMRRGIGTSLLTAACDWAAARGYRAVTLTTFADIAWNAPFYAARGFVEWPEPSPGLVARRAHERDLGLDDVGRRIVMRREL